MPDLDQGLVLGFLQAARDRDLRTVVTEWLRPSRVAHGVEEQGRFDLIFLEADAASSFPKLECQVRRAMNMLTPGGILWLEGYHQSAPLRRLVDDIIFGTGICHAYIGEGRGHVLLQRLRKGC